MINAPPPADHILTPVAMASNSYAVHEVHLAAKIYSRNRHLRSGGLLRFQKRSPVDRIRPIPCHRKI